MLHAGGWRLLPTVGLRLKEAQSPFSWLRRMMQSALCKMTSRVSLSVKQPVVGILRNTLMQSSLYSWIQLSFLSVSTNGWTFFHLFKPQYPWKHTHCSSLDNNWQNNCWWTHRWSVSSMWKNLLSHYSTSEVFTVTWKPVHL